jgi:hypothetical protein
MTGLLLTYTGEVVNVGDLLPTMVRLPDLAQGLAFTVRFRGSLGCAYTVAQHAVMASYHRACASSSARKAALLHDAAEAYLGDVPSPVWGVLGASWSKLEARVSATIFERYGVDQRADCSAVAEADLDLLRWECIAIGYQFNEVWRRAPSFISHLFGEPACASDAERFPYMPEHRVDPRKVWSHGEAAGRWLQRCRELGIEEPRT